MNYFFYTPYGWYVDDIAVIADDWRPVAQTGATQRRLQRGPGTYYYRVSTNYAFDGLRVPSLYSNVVRVDVRPAPGLIAR